MSSFRRAPNVSQYIANLNSISPRDSSPQENFLNDDLDLFTTTDFIDFDMGDNIPAMPLSNDLQASIDAAADAHPNIGFVQTQPGQDWSNDFNFSADFQPFPPLLDTSAATAYPTLPAQTTQSLAQTPITPASSAPKAGEKRKLPPSDTTSISPITDAKHTEGAREAAEEDKRRRNTAASARFRIKKKQREADLEKKAKEMTEKAAMLETKVQQLEMENKWLKSLITEKEGKGELVVNLDSALLEQGTSEGEMRTDGVGTKKQKVEA